MIIFQLNFFFQKLKNVSSSSFSVKKTKSKAQKESFNQYITYFFPTYFLLIFLLGPCITEMSAMLGCWATHGGQPDAAACKAFANALENCMKEKVFFSIFQVNPSIKLLNSKTKKTQSVNTINYHLSRLKKWL